MNVRWQTKMLGEVLQRTETVNPLQSPGTEFDYIDVSSVSNVTFQIEETQRLKGRDAPSRARKLVRANDILFATVRPTLQRIAVVPQDLDKQICSTGYCVLRTKPEMDYRFVFYFLFSETFVEQMGRLQRGASYPAVTDGDIKAQFVPIPPLPQQKRIVAILDEVSTGIAAVKANTEKNAQNARALFASHLQEIFTRRGGGRVETTLGEVCKFVGGSQPPKSTFSNRKTSESIRLIQIRDYKSDRHVVYIPRSLARRFCEPDDVMIGRYGPPIFQILRGLEGAYNVALMKAVPAEGKLSRDYLFYFLKHSSIQEYVNYHSERAAGQSGLNKETLEPYPIALPSLPEQEGLAAVARKHEAEAQRLESIYYQKLARIETLRGALLHQAFAGAL